MYLSFCICLVRVMFLVEEEAAAAAELDDYLELARAGPSLSDEQHIYHKLTFDAVNECINDCIVDVSPQPSSLYVAAELENHSYCMIRLACPAFLLAFPYA